MNRRCYPKHWFVFVARWGRLQVRDAGCRKKEVIMKRLVKLLVVSLLTVVIVGSAFAAGIFVASNSSLVLAQAGGGRPVDTPTDIPTEFDVFYQAWELANERFVDRAALDPTEMTYGAIEGMLASLGDEGHTDFLTPEELEAQRSDISGTYKGIGARLGIRDGLPIIVTPFDGSPADKAGVKSGDIIMAVDDEDTAGLELSEIVDRIRGPEDTEVTLTLLRLDDEESESVDITIVRGEIEIPVTDWAMVPGTDVALIRLSQFSANATDHIKETIAEAEDAGATALILDVRNNPGGLLAQAVAVTSQFLDGGNVLQEEDAQGKRRVYRVQRGGVATDIPMVVLINSGTASSAEILAGALQDYDRAPLVGETTFGTGTVLEPFMLKDGSAVMLGTRQWLTAEGRLIRKQGIEPDEEVDLSITTDLLDALTLEDMTVEELLNSEDDQFLRALELLDRLPQLDEEVDIEGEDMDVSAVDGADGAASTEVDADATDGDTTDGDTTGGDTTDGDTSTDSSKSD